MSFSHKIACTAFVITVTMNLTIHFCPSERRLVYSISPIVFLISRLYSRSSKCSAAASTGEGERREKTATKKSLCSPNRRRPLATRKRDLFSKLCPPLQRLLAAPGDLHSARASSSLFLQPRPLCGLVEAAITALSLH